MERARLSALVLLCILAGCSGGSSAPGAPGASRMWRKLELAQPPPTAPLAAGQSVTMSFHEIVCHSIVNPSGQGEHDVHCDPAFTPQSINAIPIDNPRPYYSHCAVTSISGASMTVKKTDVGTNDPWCEIDIVDPATNAFGVTAV